MHNRIASFRSSRELSVLPALAHIPIKRCRPVAIVGKLPTLARRQSVFDDRSTP